MMASKALVTGAGGFIGSHLVAGLLEKGWEVRALVRYNSRSSWGWLEDIRGLYDDQLEVILGDITDGPQMDESVHNCEVIFHLAALIGIPYSYNSPASYVRTNIQGTLNLVQSALKKRVKCFVHTSTSEVYGTALYTPIDEKHPLQAQSPYSASKIGADKIVESFVDSFSLPAVIVRPFNTYGPRQSARAVIPTIISQALESSEVQLGSLSPVRDLTYITDTVAAFLSAVNCDQAKGKTINLGSGKAVSVGQLAEHIFSILGKSCKIRTDNDRIRPEKSEVMQLISDNSTARRILEWRPQVSLQNGLENTIEWMVRNKDFYKFEQYTI